MVQWPAIANRQWSSVALQVIKTSLWKSLNFEFSLNQTKRITATTFTSLHNSHYDHTMLDTQFKYPSLLQVEVLRKGDFRIMPEDSVAKSFPTLEGANSVSKDVWARTYVPWILDTLLGTNPYPTWGRGISSLKVTWWGTCWFPGG